jgi:hypothetical protein
MCMSRVSAYETLSVIFSPCFHSSSANAAQALSGNGHAYSASDACGILRERYSAAEQSLSLSSTVPTVLVVAGTLRFTLGSRRAGAHPSQWIVAARWFMAA